MASYAKQILTDGPQRVGSAPRFGHQGLCRFRVVSDAAWQSCGAVPRPPAAPILLQAVKNMFVQIGGLYTKSAPEYCV